jgi:hypothetical protein
VAAGDRGRDAVTYHDLPTTLDKFF